MENVLFYLLIILCLGLIITTAVYMKRFNKINEHLEEKQIQCLRLEGDKKSIISELGLIKLDFIRKDKEITELKNKLEEQIQISGSINKQLAEAYESKNKLQKEIEIISDANKNIVADNKKQVDEITILKEQVESLTNHLKEFVKPFDPLKELEELIQRKMETKGITKIVPKELMDQTNIMLNILSQIDQYTKLYPEDADKFNHGLLKAIKGTIKENQTKK